MTKRYICLESAHISFSNIVLSISAAGEGERLIELYIIILHRKAFCPLGGGISVRRPARISNAAANVELSHMASVSAVMREATP